MKNKITAIIFLAMIYGVFIITIVTKDKSFSESEKRILQEKPEINAESYFSGDFAKQYEEYVKDQFPARDAFVRMKNRTEIMMGKRRINGVLLCRDDYLIDDNKEEAYFSQRAKLNADAIVSAAGRWTEKLGAKHVSVLIAPTAQTVLSDKAPWLSTPYNQEKYILGIGNRLEKDVFVDVTEVLKNHRDEYIYYRTDHHWTTYGAYIAYRKWCETKKLKGHEKSEFEIEKAAEDFLGTTYSKINIETKKDTIEIYKLKDYNVNVLYNMSVESDTLFDYSFLDKKDKYSVFFGGNQGIVEITPESSKKKSKKKSETSLLILKDSYANCFVPMTVDLYDKVYVVDLRYFNMNIDEFMDENRVTDVLVLYNANTLTDDMYVGRIR